MVNPNVAWKKYLNSSNPIINRYLNDYGDNILHQTFQRLTSAITLNLCIKLEKYELCRDIHNKLKLIKLKKARGKPQSVTAKKLKK